MSGFQTMLDPTLHSPEVREFERALEERVVGQARAIRRLARIYQVYKAGLAVPGRPLVRNSPAWHSKSPAPAAARLE